jgi:hypothetical protein
MKRSNSLYNSPIFCTPKKQGEGLRIMQDFWELNQNSHIDIYSMKEITECIGISAELIAEFSPLSISCLDFSK